jgi:hypothetical protein
MPAVFVLDQVIKVGSEYRTKPRHCLVIQKIGTNATSAIHLNIDNKALGDVRDLVAPAYVTSSNTLGPLDLGKLPYVVPPETRIVAEGPSGTYVRIIGVQKLLAPGEPTPGPDMARFSEQGNHYLVWESGSYSHGTDVALPADAEVEIFSLTPKTIETVILNNIVEVSVSNYTPSPGDLGVRFYLDNKPLDELLDVTRQGGVDILSMPRPPADGTEEKPFSLASSPIEVPGDHTLSIRVRNTKGASISPSAGTSLVFNVDLVAEYIRKV